MNGSAVGSLGGGVDRLKAYAGVRMEGKWWEWRSATWQEERLRQDRRGWGTLIGVVAVDLGSTWNGESFLGGALGAASVGFL